MGLLVNKRQVGAKIEAVEGTFEGGLPGSVVEAEFLVISPSMSPNALLFERDVVKGDLTPLDQFAPGVSSVELRFGVELAGHTDNLTGDFVEPAVMRLLSACGFISHAVQGITVGAFTTGEVFKHGETVNQATSSAVGVVVGEAVSGVDTKLYVDADTPPSPAFNGSNAITGADTGTVETPSAVDGDTHWSLAPVSDPALVPSLSIVYYVDGKRMSLKGARGNAEIVFEHAKPVRVNFTFIGIVNSYIDGALLSAPPIKQETPPANLNTALVINTRDGTGTAFTPTYNSLTFSTANQLTLREDSSDSDGWTAAAVTARSMTGRINFDEVITATFDAQANFKAGTTMLLRATVGDTVGNRFRVRVPAFQFASLAEGDRDGVTIWDAGLTLRGGLLDVQTPANTKLLGGDNELVFFND